MENEDEQARRDALGVMLILDECFSHLHFR